MNKAELIAATAERTSMSKADVERMLDAVLETITHQLKGGNEVRLVGFGNFLVSERKGGTGRNPRTGETMEIAATKSPKFRAGKQLKDAVNG
jgi:DNA-binding protein HU-beta